MPRAKNKRKIENYSEQAFYVHDGKIILNLRDLLNIIKTMDDNIFRYHVNKEKNDFVVWINNVLHDYDLGRKLKRYKAKHSFVSIIEYHIKKFYEK